MGEAAAAGWTHPSIIPTIRGEDALFAPSPELTDFAHNLLDCKVVDEVSGPTTGRAKCLPMLGSLKT